MASKSSKIMVRPIGPAKIAKDRAGDVFASSSRGKQVKRDAVPGQYVIHGKKPNPNRVRQSFRDALRDSVRTNREAIRQLADK